MVAVCAAAVEDFQVMLERIHVNVSAYKEAVVSQDALALPAEMLMLKTLEDAQNQQQCAGLVMVLAAVSAPKVAALDIVSVQQAQVCSVVFIIMVFAVH